MTKTTIKTLAAIASLGTALAITTPTLAADYGGQRHGYGKGDYDSSDYQRNSTHLRKHGDHLSGNERAYLEGRRDARREMWERRRLRHAWWRHNYLRDYGWGSGYPKPRWW